MAAVLVVVGGGFGLGLSVGVGIVVSKVMLAEAPGVLGVGDRRREVGVEVGLGGAGGD